MPLVRPMVVSQKRNLSQGLVDFDPGLVPDMAYYGSADGPNVLSGAVVSQLSDQSGNGHHANQNTANKQPTFIASSADFKGQACLDFDGTDDDMSFSGNALNIFRNVDGYSYTLAMKADQAILSTVFAFQTAAGVGRTALNTEATPRFAGWARRLDADTAQSTIGGTFNTTNSFVITFWVDHQTTTGKLYKNAGEIASNTSLLTAGKTQNTASSIGGIGGNVAAQSAFFNGKIAALVIHPRPLSNLERLYIDSGLMEKYVG